jgi:hypothetical protein
MAEEMQVKIGKGQTALVRRVVPGKLVYVELKPDEVYAMKLDNIVIRKSDGSYDHYRGEPLAALGLDSGRTVTVWTDNEGMVPRNLVVDANPVSRSIIESTISNVAEYFKR